MRPPHAVAPATARRAVVAHVSKPPHSGGGHGAVGDHVTPNVVSGGSDASVSSESATSYGEWTSDAAALDAAAAERETSISELQAMLASMGQPAPPPPPAVDPPASVAAAAAAPAVPAATLDIMPPPSPAKKAPALAPTAAPALASAAAAPAAPASADDFRRENGAEVAAMLAAEAPATTPQQCTAEVGGLLSRLQAADIPPPLSRGRFKLKVMKPDEAMEGKKQRPAGGPPLGTSAAPPESPESVDAPPEARGGARRLARSADDALAADPAAAGVDDVVDDVPEPQPAVSPEPSLLSQEEDMLFAEAVLAEAARLAQEEATAEETLRAEADAIVADAVAAEALFDDYASLAADGDFLQTTEALDVEALRQSTSTTPMTPTMTHLKREKREASSGFPPAEAWYTPAAETEAQMQIIASEDELLERDDAFSGKLARAVRSIQGWFTGVPFLDFEEPPSPGVVAREAVVQAVAEEAVVEEVEDLEARQTREALGSAPEFSGAMARALRVFDAGTFSTVVPSVPSVPSVPAAAGGTDLYDMVPMIEGDPASLEACVEEMDYESYLAFHGMEVLEGTPPQVLEVMVAEMKGGADAAEAVKRMDARDLAQAVRSSGETGASSGASSGASKWSRMASSSSATRATEQTEQTSEISEISGTSFSSSSSPPDASPSVAAASADAARAASLAADVERLERQIEEMASTARAAKREADHNKEQLASAYARDARVDELFAEAEKWRLAAEAAEEARAAFAAEQSEKKAAFVRDAEARLAEAREAADAHEAEASRLRGALDAQRRRNANSLKKEDVSARVRTLKSALAEKTAALARAERDALHLARVADQTAALASHGTTPSDMSSGDAVRAARLAAAEAAEDAAAKITEAAEKLMDAKRKAARAENAARAKDDELAGVRAELEEAYARAADSRRAEKEAKEAAAAAAFCAAAGLIAAMRREDVNALVFA